MAIALSQEELVQQWENFFRDYYKDRIEETALAWPEERALVVDYKDIDLRDITLAEHVLENPVAAFVTAERALRLVDVPVEPRPRLRFRVTGLPESAHVQVRKLRAAHLGKMVAVVGLIKKVTEVRPKLEDAAFRCSLCGCVFRHPQQGELVLEEPEICPEERGGCGRNARFKVVSEQSEFIDHQKVEIQESPEGLKGGAQPERLAIYVEDDLVGQLTPGDRVTLNVVMRSQARRQGMLKLTEFAKVGDLVSIQHEQHDFDEVEIEPEDEERIIELAQNPHIYETLRKSFSPTIFGLEREKDALVLALFGGVAKDYPDGSRTRGDIHVLMVGDPGTGKSQLLRYMSKLAPRSIYTSGKSASAAGLCVAPDTLVSLSDGELVEIGPFTESRMAVPERVEEGVWRQWTNGVGVDTVDGNLKLNSRQLEAVWRLRSPNTLLEIEAHSGRRLTVSKATPLPVRDADQGVRWVPASELGSGTHLATPRRLPEPPGHVPCILDLLEDSLDCTVEGVEGLMRRIAKSLRETRGSLKGAAHHLEVPEDALCGPRVNEEARGRPSLGDVLRLADAAGFTRREVAGAIGGYSRGQDHRIRLPETLDSDLLYLVGLIAADGSLDEHEDGRVAIRFCSRDGHLMESYLRLCERVLGVRPDVASGSPERPPEARIYSRILADLLERFGIPRSPKSHRVELPPVLQRLPNEHLAAYLRGLFDGAGSCRVRRTGDSSVALYTPSANLVRKLQVLLLRYGIQATLRTRNREDVETDFRHNGNTTGHDVHVLTIMGSEDLASFADSIGFAHPGNQARLEEILGDPRQPDPNRDGVPDVNGALRRVREILGLSRAQLRTPGNLEEDDFLPSRGHLEGVVNRLQEVYESGDFMGTSLLIGDETRRACMLVLREKRSPESLAEAFGTKPLRVEEWTTRLGDRTRIGAQVLLRMVRLLREEGHNELAARVAREADLVGYQAELASVPVQLRGLVDLSRCDVHWDPVVAVRPVERPGPYIYDLTVDGTHNFVANGLLAHNTAAAVRDEFGEGQWTLEAGALVLADQGIACVDELDKMGKEDQSSMHQAMEQQEISVAKAGIQATLKSRCAVIGGANPKMGRFDSYAPIHDQINMPPALLSRFDLIFSLKDEPKKDLDDRLAAYILRNHRAGEVAMHRMNRPDGQYSAEEERFLFEKITPELDPEFLRKYIAYAKRHVFPVLDDEAIELIKEYYVDLRNSQGEGLAFTARQLEAFVRLAEASARVRLSEVAAVDDAKRAIAIVEYYLKGVGMDPESGTFDIDMIVTGTSHTQRDRMTAMIHIIRDLSKESKHKVAQRDDILEQAEASGIENDKAESALQQLKAKGQVYEPRSGHYRLT